MLAVVYFYCLVLVLAVRFAIRAYSAKREK
jgi:hypothetical protein